MAVSLKHKFTSPKSNGLDATRVQPTNWNDEHDLELASGRLLGRTTAGAGAAQEITPSADLTLAGLALGLSFSVTAFAKTLLDDADAAAAQTTLGVGLVRISRTVLGSDATSISVTWDNADYDTIEIHAQNIVPVTDLARILGRTSEDGSSYDTGASNYGWRRATRQLGGTEAATSEGDTESFIDMTGAVGNDTANGGASFTVTIRNAGISNRQTKLDWVGSYHTGTASTEAGVQGWAIRSVAQVVTGFRILASSSVELRAGAIVTVYGYRK